MVRQACACFIVGGIAIVAGVVQAADRAKPVVFKDEDQVLNAPFNIQSLNRLSLAALSGTPSESGTFLTAFDRKLESSYVARSNGPAHLDVVFARPQVVRSLILHLGEGRYRWSAAVAESAVELDDPSRARELVPVRTSPALAGGDEVKLSAGISVRALRLTISPETPDGRVSVREVNLLGDQKLEAISLDAPSTAAPIGDMVPLRLLGYFSGGETREIAGSGLKWTVTPRQAARVAQHNRVLALRRGIFQITVSLGRYTSPALTLEAVEAN